MATPLNNHPEWDPAVVDGPAEVAAMARSLEKNTILRFVSASARDSAFTAAGVAYGAGTTGWVCALDDDAAALYVHDGTASATGWRRHGPDSQKPLIDVGSVTAELSAASFVSVAVTFEPGLFTSAPGVVTNVNSAAGGANGMTSRAYNISAGGCTIGVTAPASTTGAFPISWIATQKVAG